MAFANLEKKHTDTQQSTVMCRELPRVPLLNLDWPQTPGPPRPTLGRPLCTVAGVELSAASWGGRSAGGTRAISMCGGGTGLGLTSAPRA